MEKEKDTAVQPSDVTASPDDLLRRLRERYETDDQPGDIFDTDSAPSGDDESDEQDEALTRRIMEMFSSSAAVQQESATPYFISAFSAAIFSSSLMFFPTVDIQLVSYASVRYLSSSPCIVGEERYIFFSKGSKFIPISSDKALKKFFYLYIITRLK